MSGLLRFIYTASESSLINQTPVSNTTKNIETLSLFFNCLYNKVVGGPLLRATDIIFANSSSVFLLGKDNKSNGDRTATFEHGFSTEQLSVSNFIVALGINGGVQQEVIIAASSSTNTMTFTTHTGQKIAISLRISKSKGNSYKAFLKVVAPHHDSNIEAVSIDMSITEEITMDQISTNVNARAGRGKSIQFKSFLVVENVGGAVASVVSGMAEIIGNKDNTWPDYADYHWSANDPMYDMVYRPTSEKNTEIDREVVEVAFKTNVRTLYRCILWNAPNWDHEVVDQLSMYTDNVYQGPRVEVDQFQVRDLLVSYKEYIVNSSKYTEEARQDRIRNGKALDIDGDNHIYEIINFLNIFNNTYGDDKLSWVFLEMFEAGRIAELCPQGFVCDFLELHSKLGDLEIRAVEDSEDEHVTEDGTGSDAASTQLFDENGRPSFDKPTRSITNFLLTEVLAAGSYDVYSPIVKLRINRLQPRGKHYSLRYVDSKNNLATEANVQRIVRELVREYIPNSIECVADGNSFELIMTDNHTLYDLMLLRHFVRNLHVPISNVNHATQSQLVFKFDFKTQYVSKDVRTQMKIFDDLEVLSSWNDRVEYGQATAMYARHIMTLNTVGRLIPRGFNAYFNVVTNVMTTDHRNQFIDSINSTTGPLTLVPVVVKHDLFGNENSVEENRNLMKNAKPRGLVDLYNQISDDEFSEIDLDYLIIHHFLPRLTEGIDVGACRDSFDGFINVLLGNLNKFINDLMYFHKVLPYFTAVNCEYSHTAVWKNGSMVSVPDSDIRKVIDDRTINLEYAAANTTQRLTSRTVLVNGSPKYTALKIPQRQYGIYAQYLYCTQYMAMTMRAILMFLNQSAKNTLYSKDFIASVAAMTRNGVIVSADDLPMNLESIVWFRTILNDNHDLGERSIMILRKLIWCLEMVFQMTESWYVSELIDSVGRNLQNSRINFVRTFVVSKVQLTQACFDRGYNLPNLRASANFRVSNVVSKIAPVYRRQQESNINQYREVFSDWNTSPYEYQTPDQFLGLELTAEQRKAIRDIVSKDSTATQNNMLNRLLHSDPEKIKAYVNACASNPLLYQLSVDDMVRFKFFLMNDNRISKLVYEGKTYHIVSTGLGIAKNTLDIPGIARSRIVENVLAEAKDIVNYINLRMIDRVQKKIVKRMKPFNEVDSFVEKIVAHKYAITVKNVALDASNVSRVSIPVTMQNFHLFVHLNPTISSKFSTVTTTTTNVEEFLRQALDVLTEFKNRDTDTFVANTYTRITNLEKMYTDKLRAGAELTADENHFLELKNLYNSYATTYAAIRKYQTGLEQFIFKANLPDININALIASIQARFIEFSRRFGETSEMYLETDISNLIGSVVGDLRNNGYLTYDINELPKITDDDIIKMIHEPMAMIFKDDSKNKLMEYPVNPMSENAIKDMSEVLFQMCARSVEFSRILMNFMVTLSKKRIITSRTMERLHDTVLHSFVEASQDDTAKDITTLNQLVKHNNTFVEENEDGELVENFDTNAKPSRVIAGSVMVIEQEPAMTFEQANQISFGILKQNFLDLINQKKADGTYHDWINRQRTSGKLTKYNAKDASSIDENSRKMMVYLTNNNELEFYENKHVNFFEPTKYLEAVFEINQTSDFRQVVEIETEEVTEDVITTVVEKIPGTMAKPNGQTITQKVSVKMQKTVVSPQGRVYATTLYQLYLHKMQDFLKDLERNPVSLEEAKKKYQTTCIYFLYEVMLHAHECSTFREALMDYVYYSLLYHNLVSYMPDVPLYYVETKDSKCKLKLGKVNYNVASIPKDIPAFIKIYNEMRQLNRTYTSNSEIMFSEFDYHLFQNDGMIWVRNRFGKSTFTGSIEDYHPKVMELDFGNREVEQVRRDIQTADMLALSLEGVVKYVKLARKFVSIMLILHPDPKEVRPVAGPIGGLYITALNRILVEKLAYDMKTSMPVAPRTATMVIEAPEADTRELGDIVVNATRRIRDTMYARDQNAFLQPASDNVDELMDDPDCKYIVVKNPQMDITYAYPIPEHDGAIPSIQPYMFTDSIVRKTVYWNGGDDSTLIKVSQSKEVKATKQLQYFLRIYLGGMIKLTPVTVGNYMRYITENDLPVVETANIETLRSNLQTKDRVEDVMMSTPDSPSKLKVDLYNMIFTVLGDYPDPFNYFMTSMRALSPVQFDTILGKADRNILLDVISRTFSWDKDPEELLNKTMQLEITRYGLVYAIGLFRPKIIAFLTRN